MYELAYHLHMPVYKLTSEMPYEEMRKWYDYFQLRPVGWRDDDRTMKLLQVQGTKAKPEDVFTSLARLKEGSARFATIGNQLKNSAVFSLMMNAVGGDSLKELYGEGLD